MGKKKETRKKRVARKKRLTEFSVDEIKKGAESISAVTASLEGIVAAMDEEGVTEVEVDGYKQLEAGLKAIRNFTLHVHKGLERKRLGL